jgi:peptidoglycan/xylan/chitin deacetylase (PgdA/CDA1 family)
MTRRVSCRTKRGADVSDGHVPILMYHSISVLGDGPFRPFCVAPALFREHLRVLADEGYATMTVRDFMGWRATKRTSPPRVAVLTFDDGFADFHEQALPALAERGATATLFVTTGYVGGTSAWLSRIGQGNRRLLSWPQIEDCHRAGIEIGGHSIHHPALDLLPPAVLHTEIFGCKQAIEDRLGTSVRSFAYPFGYVSRMARTSVIEAGFESACAVRYAQSGPADDSFQLSRLIVRDGCSAKDLVGLLTARAGALSDRLRSRIWRGLRLIPSEVIQR